MGLGALVGAFAALVLHVSLSGAIGVGLLTAVFSMYSVAKGALYGFDRVVPYTWLEIAGSVVAVVATIVVVASGSHAYLAPLIIGYAVLMVGAGLGAATHGRTSSGRGWVWPIAARWPGMWAWPASVVSPAPACCNCSPCSPAGSPARRRSPTSRPA